MSTRCVSCNRTFAHKTALRQHKRNAPAHAFHCATCNRRFSSEEALEQHSQRHLRKAPVHAPSFDCNECNRSFGTSEALKQHLRTSSTHQQSRRRQSPLDTFFSSFPTFTYDPAVSPAVTYERLQQHQRWRRDTPASKDAWNRYQLALESELRMWFGNEDDLLAWHTLLHAIGIKRPLPQTPARCEAVARKTHVNIIDLIEWGRRGGTKERVQTFRTVPELRIYTKDTGKIFSNTFQDQDDGNVVLRHLLRKIFAVES